MSGSLNTTIDNVIREEVDRLTAPTGNYEYETLKSAVLARLTAVDVDVLKRGAIDSRFTAYQKRQADLARSRQQQGLPGEFAPPEGEFHFDGTGVKKARAQQDDWLRWIQQKVDHISDAQAALQTQMAEYRAYAPYLAAGMTTQQAYDAYRGDNPQFGSAQAAD